MSTVTGQSLVQPLQARQRSSASCTSRRARSRRARSPFSISKSSSRAAARRVLLLARDHEARAHDAAVGAAALADPDAARRRVRERAVVVREREVRLHLAAAGSRRRAAGSRDRVRVDDLARVHLPVRVPDRLELAERLDQLARTSSAAARPCDWPSPCSPESEPPCETTRSAASSRKERNARMPGSRLQVEVRARVDAALAVVAVERALVAVLAGELAEVAQVVAEPLRRDGRVLPALLRVGLAGDERGRAETRLAHLPDVLLLLRSS